MRGWGMGDEVTGVDGSRRARNDGREDVGEVKREGGRERVVVVVVQYKF